MEKKAFRLLNALSVTAAVLWLLDGTAFKRRCPLMMSESEVLELLDETMSFERGDIPSPPDIYNINFQFVEGRLSVFREEEWWVLAFETISYVPGGCSYGHGLWLYGNCIKGQVYHQWNELPIRIDREGFWDYATGAFLVPRNHLCIPWNDQMLEFFPMPEEYAAAGVIFPPERQQANDVEPLELLAYLCWKLNSPFFLSEEELAATVRKAVVEGTGEMKLIFQTREWQHPFFDARELPSQLPGMQVLAHLIATGDPSVWKEFRREWVNTRFSHVVQVNWEFIYPSKPSSPPEGGPTYLLLPFDPEEWQEIVEDEDKE